MRILRTDPNREWRSLDTATPVVIDCAHARDATWEECTVSANPTVSVDGASIASR